MASGISKSASADESHDTEVLKGDSSNITRVAGGWELGGVAKVGYGNAKIHFRLVLREST